MSITADLVETVTPAAAGDARRLTTAANVRAVIGSPAGDDGLLETLIDRISASAARYCNLAADAIGGIPTFGSEVLRATWFVARSCRGCHLALPWRQPFTAVGSVVEAGVTLTPDTQYRLLGQSGLIVRLTDDTERAWSSGKIVIQFTAGWSLPAGVAPEVEAAVISQVSMIYQGRDRDPAERSFAIPDVYQANFSVAGGTTIGESGLLPNVEAALDQYRKYSV